MITMTLDKHSAEDFAEIQKLKEMGVPDEVIQAGYDNTVAARKESDNGSRKDI